MPEAGSQPSQSAKITISTMPSQNDGMLAPKSEATALSRSSSECGRAAEAMPSARPPMVESRSALAGEEQRRLEALEHLGQHRALHPDRAAEVAADARGRSSAAYCTWQRLGQPQLGAAGASRSSWVGLRAQHHLGRVARREVEHHEDDTDTPSRTGTSSRSRRAR